MWWGCIIFLSHHDFNVSMNNVVLISCSPLTTECLVMNDFWEKYMVLPLDAGKSGTCSWINSEQCARWCTAWRGMCLLSTHFTKLAELWPIKDGFGGISTWEKHHPDMQSAFWVKFELTGYICKNKKRVVERHGPASPEDNVVCVCEALLQIPRNMWFNRLISQGH
jgi:hypothetical protein